MILNYQIRIYNINSFVQNAQSCVMMLDDIGSVKIYHVSCINPCIIIRIISPDSSLNTQLYYIQYIMICFLIHHQHECVLISEQIFCDHLGPSSVGSTTLTSAQTHKNEKQQHPQRNMVLLRYTWVFNHLIFSFSSPWSEQSNHYLSTGIPSINLIFIARSHGDTWPQCLD